MYECLYYIRDSNSRWKILFAFVYWSYHWCMYVCIDCMCVCMYIHMNLFLGNGFERNAKEWTRDRVCAYMYSMYVLCMCVFVSLSKFMYPTLSYVCMYVAASLVVCSATSPPESSSIRWILSRRRWVWVCTDVCLRVCVHACMHVCMYVSRYEYMHSSIPICSTNYSCIYCMYNYSPQVVYVFIIYMYVLYVCM